MPGFSPVAVTELPFLTAAFGTTHLDIKRVAAPRISGLVSLLAHELMILLPFDFVRKGNRETKLSAKTASGTCCKKLNQKKICTDIIQWSDFQNCSPSGDQEQLKNQGCIIF